MADTHTHTHALNTSKAAEPRWLISSRSASAFIVISIIRLYRDSCLTLTVLCRFTATSKQDYLELHVNSSPCIWCKRCCILFISSLAPLLSVSPDLYPLSRTWKATPRICSAFLLTLLLSTVLASAATDEERWSHLWRGSVQHCNAPRPHLKTHHTTPHTPQCTYRQQWRTLMNLCLYSAHSCAAVPVLGGLAQPGAIVQQVYLLYPAKLFYHLFCAEMHWRKHSNCHRMKTSFGWC